MFCYPSHRIFVSFYFYILEKKFLRVIQFYWTNQGITVNLPLASANRSSADADGLEIVRILGDIRLGQLYRRWWNADSSSIPQAMQIDSSIRPMLCRCLLNGQCPVMSPIKILNLDLGSLSKHLVKPELGFFSHLIDCRQAWHLKVLTEDKAPVPQKQNLIPLLQVRRPPHLHGYHCVQGPTPVEHCYTKPVPEENLLTVVQLWKTLWNL
jgi:hypothetical protein